MLNRLNHWSRKVIRSIPPLHRAALKIRDRLSGPYIDRIARLEAQISTLQGQSIYLNFVPPGHYYSTIPSLEDLQKDQERLFSTAYRELPGVDLSPDSMLANLEQFKLFYSDFPYSEIPNPNLRFYLANEVYSRGDAVLLYSMMRSFKPQSIVEVGSGLSTCLMLDVNEKFFGNQISLTVVDPYPDRMLNMVFEGDEKNLQVVPKRLQDVNKDIFTALEADDIVFVDSSHVSKCGSDVNHIFFEILPIIKPGVIIHFHDIFYPFEYPRQWLLEIGAAWNESYLLHAFLQYNYKFEILFFCDYINHFHREAVGTAIPVFLKGPGSSIWLRKM